MTRKDFYDVLITDFEFQDNGKAIKDIADQIDW